MQINKEALYEQVLDEWKDKDIHGNERSVLDMFVFMNQYWARHDKTAFKSGSHLPDRWKMLPDIISDSFLGNDVTIDLFAKSSELKKQIMSIVIDKIAGFKFDYNDVKLIATPTAIIIAKEYKERRRLIFDLPLAWKFPNQYLYLNFVAATMPFLMAINILRGDMVYQTHYVIHKILAAVVLLFLVVNWLLRCHLVNSSYVNRDRYIECYSYSTALCILGLIPSAILYLQMLAT